MTGTAQKESPTGAVGAQAGENESTHETGNIVHQAQTHCKCFADTQAKFALLGYELRAHTTAPGLVHIIHDDDAPQPSKAATRTTFIVSTWHESRHLATWPSVVALLTALQDAARG